MAARGKTASENGTLGGRPSTAKSHGAPKANNITNYFERVRTDTMVFNIFTSTSKKAKDAGDVVKGKKKDEREEGEEEEQEEDEEKQEEEEEEQEEEQ